MIDTPAAANVTYRYAMCACAVRPVSTASWPVWVLKTPSVRRAHASRGSNVLGEQAEHPNTVRTAALHAGVGHLWTEGRRQGDVLTGRPAVLGAAPPLLCL